MSNSRLWFIALALVETIIVASEIIAGNGKILNTGDISWPIYFDRFYELTLGSIDDSYGFGNPASRQHASLPFALVGNLALSLGIDSSLFQRIAFALPIVLAGYGCVLFGKLLGWEQSQRYLFAIFYLISSISYSYWSPDHGLNLFAYFLFPLTMAFSLQYIKTGEVCCLLLLFLSSLNPSYSNPVFLFINILAVALLLIVVGIDRQKTFRSSALRALGATTVILAANMYWILPFIIEIKLQFVMASNKIAGLMSDFDIARGDSLNIATALTGNGGGFWVAGAEFVPGEPYRLWGAYTRSYPFLLLNALLTLTCISYLVRLCRRNIVARYVLLMFLGTVLLISGMKLVRPFSFPAEILLKIPGLGRGFRSVYMKLGFILAFFWSAILSYSFCFCREKISTLYIKFITLSSLFLQMLCEKYNALSSARLLPFLIKGTVFVKCYIYRWLVYILIATLIAPHLLGMINRSNGGLARPPDYIEIPAEYHQLRTLNKFERGFPSPLAVIDFSFNSYNVWLKWGASDGYIGSDFLRTIYSGPILSFDDGSNSFFDLRQKCSGISNLCINHLREIGVKYLLLRKDLAEHDKLVKNISIKRILDRSSQEFGIEPVLSNDKFDVFAIKSNVPNSQYWGKVTGELDLQYIASGFIHYSNQTEGSMVSKSGLTGSQWHLCKNDRLWNGMIGAVLTMLECGYSHIALNLGHSNSLSGERVERGNGYLIYIPTYGFLGGMIVSLLVFLTLIAVTVKRKLLCHD